MYKVICIIAYEMTRTINLKNSDTGAIEDCFDDSDVVSDKNFNFMELDCEYDCKIKLVGDIVQENKSNAMLCTVVCKDVLVGTRNMVKVVCENNYYYIPKEKLGNFEAGDTFCFECYRKDLIQVDKMIHADLL